jgi:hypothetical protein
MPPSTCSARPAHPLYVPVSIPVFSPSRTALPSRDPDLERTRTKLYSRFPAARTTAFHSLHRYLRTTMVGPDFGLISTREPKLPSLLPHSFQKQVNLSFSTVSLATTCQAHLSVGKETIMRDIASSMQFVNILHLAIFFFSSNWNNGGKEPKRVSLVRLA